MILHYRIRWETASSVGVMCSIEVHTQAALVALIEYLTRADVSKPTNIYIEPFVPMQPGG